ncbi:hypothetical protein C7M84_009003 [Penaeus vannamei]|uniref:Uncharacterized protein n=1 Tax=Penaeus vannamei TaxID=6689 RepID=A0A423UAD5_PENVA|nr:hypothetical protein C7M84_009003 [Penaeus vannamei]
MQDAAGRSATTRLVLFRHDHIRRTLVSELRRLEKGRRRAERSHAQQVVLFLAGASQRRDARTAHLARLNKMFRVKQTENESGTDSEGAGPANSSTESEVSVGSYQSSSLSQGGAPADRAALWVADTPRRQRAASVDVPSGGPRTHPAPPLRPEVVVTHVGILEDASPRPRPTGPPPSNDTADTPTDTSTPTPARENGSTPTQGRLSPTNARGRPATPSPPRTPSRRQSHTSSSRPGSRMSRVSKTSLAFRRSRSSPATQQEVVPITEVTAPLEDTSFLPPPSLTLSSPLQVRPTEAFSPPPSLTQASPPSRFVQLKLSLPPSPFLDPSFPSFRFVQLLSSLTLVAAPETLTTQRLTKGPEIKQDAAIILRF